MSIGLFLRALIAALEAVPPFLEFLKRKDAFDKQDKLNRLDHEITAKSSDPNFSGAELVLMLHESDALSAYLKRLYPEDLHGSAGNNGADKGGGVGLPAKGDAGSPGGVDAGASGSVDNLPVRRARIVE